MYSEDLGLGTVSEHGKADLLAREQCAQLKTKSRQLNPFVSIYRDHEQRGIIERVNTKKECEIGKTTFMPQQLFIHRTMFAQNSCRTD